MTSSIRISAACLGLAFGCAFAAEPPPEPPAAPPSFSGERAFAQLEALAALGPRVAGTEAAAAGRARVRGELKALGLEVHEDAFRASRGPDEPELALANLWADVPGAQADLFAVAAALDSPSVPDAEAGGSGVAVLLELARTLHERPLPYTVRLLFLDGEFLDERTPFLGSQRAFGTLVESGAIARLRLFLYLHRVGDRELEIRRDRFSDRRLRDLFFAAAAKRGLGGAFPREAPFDELRLGHLVFSRRRFPAVVALADWREGADDVVEPGAPPPEDALAQSSPESLAVVGTVVRAGLEAAAARGRVVDRVRGEALRGEDRHPPPAPAAPTGGEDHGE